MSFIYTASYRGSYPQTLRCNDNLATSGSLCIIQQKPVTAWLCWEESERRRLSPRRLTCPTAGTWRNVRRDPNNNFTDAKLDEEPFRRFTTGRANGRFSRDGSPGPPVALALAADPASARSEASGLATPGYGHRRPKAPPSHQPWSTHRSANFAFVIIYEKKNHKVYTE